MGGCRVRSWGGQVVSDETPSLQAMLEGAQVTEGEVTGELPSVADPVALIHHLEASHRFYRDAGVGRIFHPGRVSFRENLPGDSLHLVIEGNHLAAHIDRVSPLRARPGKPPRYSLRRATAHNLAGAAHDAFRLVMGRQGDHRSELDCEWVWDQSSVPPPLDLLERELAAWSVQVEAQVSGSLDEGRLRSALAAVLRRHTFDHDPLWVVDRADDEGVAEARWNLQGRPAGMDEWPPLRAALVHCRGGDMLMLNVNHAASDGVDALRLLRTIAAAYATGTAPDPPPDLYAVRELPVRPASASEPPLLARGRAVVERVRDLLARPVQLQPDGKDDDDSAFGFHLRCLPPEPTRRAVNAQRPGTSRNVLLASLHLAIGRWNLEHGQAGGRVGVLVPVDLRPSEWPEETVGNFSVTARVSTDGAHRTSPAAALKAVTSQTVRSRRARTGTALLDGLHRSGLLPLWSKQSPVVLQPVTRNRLLDTALLADLGWQGDPPSFGEGAGDTTHLWFSLPARSPLTLSIGALTVCDRLHLVLRYPHRLFSDEAASRFADHLVAEITGVEAGDDPAGGS